VQFAIDGDLRFLSHHDTLRMFERAAIRSRLPLKYSAGFNPSPRLGLPLPRPVGVAGREEWLLLHLTEPPATTVVTERLAARLPRDLRIRATAVAHGNASWQAAEAEYEVPLPGEVAQPLPARIERLMASGSAVIERQMGPAKPSKTVDARRFLLGLERHEQRLHMHVLYDAGATVRPSEVLELLGVPAQPYGSRITRTRIAWGPRNLSDQPVLSDQSRPAKEAGNE
jgi:radical SAM-linked protein